MAGKIHPDDSFKEGRAMDLTIEAMEKYWRYGGEPCEYVPSLILHPGYRELEWKRLRYYLHWRSDVFDGLYGDTDSGYIWLHSMELLLVNDDPEEADRCFRGMIEAYKGQNNAVDYILTATSAFHQASNHMMISDYPALNRSLRTLRICMILSSEKFVPLSAEDIRFITGRKGTKIDKYADEMAIIVSSALHEIGRWQKPNGILSLCARPLDTYEKYPFAYDIWYIPKELRFRCRDIKNSEIFVDLTKKLHKACVLYLAGNDDIDSLAGKYAATLRKCIEAHKNGTLGEITAPYRKTGSPWDETMHSHNGRFEAHRKDGVWPSYRFQSRMREYSMVMVPSTGRIDSNPPPEPCYSSMTLGMFGEYQSWKDSVLRGEKTIGRCRGFSWLLSQEILCDPSLDPESAIHALTLCKNNSDSPIDKRIDNAIIELCLIDDLNPPELDRYSDLVRVEALTTRALLSEPPRDLSSEQIRRCWDGESDDPALTDAVNASLKLLHSKGSRLSTIADMRTITQTISTFEGFAGMPISVDVKIFGPGNKDFVRIISSICKIASAAISGEKCPRCPSGFGSNNRDIVCEATLIALKERESKKRRESMANMRLDMSAIEEAENDLRDIAKMLGAEVEDEPLDIGKTIVNIEIKTIVEKTGDPWKDFAAMLTEEQKQYAKECLEGTKVNRTLERAVNSAAADTIGDIVLDNGTAIEDYAQKLKETVC